MRSQKYHRLDTLNGFSKDLDKCIRHKTLGKIADQYIL